MKTTKTTRTNKRKGGTTFRSSSKAVPVVPAQPAPPPIGKDSESRSATPIPINPGCKFTVKVFGPTDLTEQYENVDIYEIKANVTQFGWAETKDGAFSHLRMIVTTLPVLVTPVPISPVVPVVPEGDVK